MAGPTDEALAEIDDRVAGGDESFWYDGTFWVGSREDAPAAFGAVAAVQDDRGRLWLKIGTGATAKGIGLAVFETPADKSVWFEIGGVEAVACSEAGG